MSNRWSKGSVPILTSIPCDADFATLACTLRLCLIVAVFIASHVKYTNPPEVLAYILYQTAKAWRFKEENMFVSIPLFISSAQGIVPR